MSCTKFHRKTEAPRPTPAERAQAQQSRRNERAALAALPARLEALERRLEALERRKP